VILVKRQHGGDARRRPAHGLCLAAALLFAPPAFPQAPDLDSLARYVPADVGLFVEVRGAEDLLTALTEPQIWTTLAELAGQPSGPQDTQEWRRQIQQTVRMEPEQAIRVLFARGVAFIGEGPGRSQDALVLCRPAAETSPNELLARWQAKRLAEPEKPEAYLLVSIGVVVLDDVLIFGDATRRDGMFQRVREFAAQRARRSLADDADFRALLARVPPRATGIVFSRAARTTDAVSPPTTQPRTPTSQPAADAASPPSASAAPPVSVPALALRSADAVLLALHREGPLLHFTAVGRGVPAPQAAARESGSLIRRLPARTLLAWEGQIDYRGLLSELERLPERDVLRGALHLPTQMESLRRLAGALGQRTCLAIGPVRAASSGPATPPLPAAALLVSAEDRGEVELEFGLLVDATVALLNVLTLGRGLPPLPPIREERVDDATALLLDLSAAAQRFDAGIGELHLCWLVDQDALIVATHLDWLREIVAARRRSAADLAPLLQLSRNAAAPGAENLIAIQSGPIADLVERWLEHLGRVRPEVLQESWWRGRQPRGDVRLGIQATPQAEQRRLRVDAVVAGLPAAGLVQPGDYIIGCNRRRFTTTQPSVEMRDGLRQRPNARWVDLIIERNETPLIVRVPVPFFDPVALRRVVAIGKLAQRVVYCDDLSATDGPRGFLTIELRTSPRPLFDFEPVPASQPAVLPARLTDRAGDD